MLGLQPCSLYCMGLQPECMWGSAEADTTTLLTTYLVTTTIYYYYLPKARL